MASVTNSKTKNPIWKYFEICKDNPKLALCLLCKTNISRGGEGKKAKKPSTSGNEKTGALTTSAPIDPSKVEVPGPSPTTKQKQLTLRETTERKLLWDINDSRSKTYHYLIGEMIAIDNEPFAVVERVGFKRLMEKAVPQYKMPSRTYMTENVIPDIYDRIHTKIKSSILQAAAISVTSDMWTNQHNYGSFLSFTAHWLSPDLNLEHGVLAIKPFSGPHTGENIAKELNAIAEVWDIPKKKIHLVVHDSGANMIKGVRAAQYDSAKCFIHSLQRSVEESIKSQEEVCEMVAAARRIVTHFNHSGTAQQKLKSIRQELNLPDHQLLQDIITRWNSTYYLMVRLLEQKRAVSLYITDHEKLNNLTPSQWELMEQCVRLLKPFEEITKITSSGLSCVSEVIPHVAILLKYLEKPETAAKTSDLFMMRSTLKTKLEKRFDFDENDKYLVATFLDPRFKCSFLGTVQAERARHKILLDELKFSCDESSSNDDFAPPNKRRNTEQGASGTTLEEIHDDFWECYDEVAAANLPNEGMAKSDIASEIDFYLKCTRLDRRADPYKWWSANSKQYPKLTKFVKVYMSSPCSSVYSERLFSEAGLVYEEKRNRLLPANAEKLVFIHHNLPLINFKY
ncbi:unnamed protein product [Diatraea saccharalis]|uniref:HAT C-terminal dimerisation domain-containing protein n=1 Tax=Diatraea saccharalis TaxID=40085 RepID=A0A9N9R587_9NEOP|nr:unnamed protein product [Diatraea saccharalis]